MRMRLLPFVLYIIGSLFFLAGSIVSLYSVWKEAAHATAATN